MARGLLRKKRASRPVDRGGGETSPFCLDIEIDEREGSLRVYDPRAFRAGRRAFCRRMLEAAAERPGFLKAEIDLASASCRLEFDRRSATSRTMADSFRAAVEDAVVNERAAARPRWWRHAPGWSTLTAYRSADGVSLWETVESRPGRISLRHPALSGDRSPLAHVTYALSALDGIERLPHLVMVAHADPGLPTRYPDRRPAPGRGGKGPPGRQGRRLRDARS